MWLLEKIMDYPFMYWNLMLRGKKHKKRPASAGLFGLFTFGNTYDGTLVSGEVLENPKRCPNLHSGSKCRHEIYLSS